MSSKIGFRFSKLFYLLSRDTIIFLKNFFSYFQANSKLCEEAPSFQDTNLTVVLFHNLSHEVCLGNSQWVEIDSVNCILNLYSEFPLSI